MEAKSCSSPYGHVSFQEYFITCKLADIEFVSAILKRSGRFQFNLNEIMSVLADSDTNRPRFGTLLESINL